MLKKSIILFSLMIYLSVNFQPLILLLSYEINFQYIKTELCENKDNKKSCYVGKCYLKKEMEKNDKENRQQVNSKDDLSEHLNSSFAFNTIINSKSIQYNYSENSLLLTLQTETPPPRI